MNNIPSDYYGIIGLLAFIIFILVDKIIVPQYKKKKNGPTKQQWIHVSGNPNSVSLEAFYQAFTDHTSNQEKWGAEMKKEMMRVWKMLQGTDKRIDEIDKRVLIMEERGKHALRNKTQR